MKTELTDNELIAEFMEFVDGGNYWAAKNPYRDFEGGPRFYTSELLFDESWDWLHPVMDKITEVSCSHSPNTPNAAGMALKLFAELPITSKIDRVYMGVVKFIKWYNTQKQST